MVGSTEEDKQHIRIGLLSLSRGCLGLLHVEGAETSLAAAAFAAGGDRRHVDGELGDLAFVAVGLTVRAVAEHVAAFVDLLERGRVSIPLASVTRSALEAGANAYFILSATDGRRLLQRALVLTIDELLIPARHTQFRTTNGQFLDPNDLLADLREHLAALGDLNTVDRLPSKSLRVSNLLAVLGHTDPVMYSQLSGLAHGVSSALAMFHVTGEGRFELDRSTAGEYVGYLYACTHVIGERLALVLGVDGADRDHWHAARDRAAQQISDYRDSLDR